MKTSERSFYFGSVGRWSVVKFALRFEAASIEAVFQYQNQYVLPPSFFRHVDIIHYSRKVRHYGQDWIIIPQKCGDIVKGGFKSEETGEFFRCQNKYSKSLSWAENLNFPPKTVNNLFKFSAQDSDLEYLFWQRKNSSVSSDLKPPLHSSAISWSELGFVEKYGVGNFMVEKSRIEKSGVKVALSQ